LIEGPKLSNFKIEGPISQNDEKRGTKTAIKPNILYYFHVSQLFKQLDYNF